jgi:hypothetical protein
MLYWLKLDQCVLESIKQKVCKQLSAKLVLLPARMEALLQLFVITTRMSLVLVSQTLFDTILLTLEESHGVITWCTALDGAIANHKPQGRWQFVVCAWNTSSYNIHGH